MEDSITKFNKTIIPTKVSVPYDFDNPIMAAIRLSNSMQMYVYDNNLVAISAPQLNINTRVIYIRGMESAMFNPIIVDSHEKLLMSEEMSASHIGLLLKIKRPQIIRVRWTDFKRKTQTTDFSSMSAIAIQRKIDFLNGVDFLSKSNYYHRNQALKKWKKLNE